MQERLLSMRILEYRRKQVHFLCPFTGDYDASKSDGWTNDWPTNNVLKFPTGTNGFIPATLFGWKIDNLADFRRVWFSIVEAYTRRHLTYSIDRTLAISGIAQRLAVMYKSHVSKAYTAGHWLMNFPQDLLWYWRRPDWTLNKRETRRCPTWAWTSIDTEIDHLRKSDTYNQQTVELVNLAVELKDNNAPFGDVKSATLTLKGRLATATCRVTRVKEFPRTMTIYDKVTGEEVCKMYFDAMTGPEDEEYSEDIILLSIGTSDWSDEENTFVKTAGLMLCEEMSQNGRRRFSRIGFWDNLEVVKRCKQAKMRKLFAVCEPETFDLI
jgi:hypothetical protein